LTVITANLDRVPLFPVTVIVYPPVDRLVLTLTLHVSGIESPAASATLVVQPETPRPDEEEVDVTFTTPEKPLRLVMVTNDESVEPGSAVMFDGLRVTVKSSGWVTTSEKEAECVSVPLVAVTVTK